MCEHHRTSGFATLDLAGTAKEAFLECVAADARRIGRHPAGPRGGAARLAKAKRVLSHTKVGYILPLTTSM